MRDRVSISPARRRWKMFFVVLIASALAPPMLTAALHEDWPQWLGPQRNGKSTETGLLRSWPAAGPPVVWRQPLGEGYSGIAIADGRAFTLYAGGDDEYAVCFDAETGARQWRVRLDRRFTNTWGNGPRMTPTVEDGRVFVISARARMFALDARSGAVLWQRHLIDDLGGIQPELGYSCSPLLVDGKLIVVTGGYQKNAVVALEPASGEVIWRGHDDHPGYSSPIFLQAAGTPQLILFTGTQIAALSPQDGRGLWSYRWRTSSYENVSTPVVVSGERIFFSSPHPEQFGSAVLQLKNGSDGLTVEPVWRNNTLKNHFSTSIAHGDYLYGTDRAILKCVDARTGQDLWQQRGFGEGTLIYADGHLIVLGTQGRLGLVHATPSGYREVGSASVLSGKCYTVPSLANGRLYLRNQRELVCLDLRIN